MSKKIIVIGATGMLGKPVTEELIKDGFGVTLLVRNRVKAQKLFSGINILEGDIFDFSSVARALGGNEAVYISVSPPRNARQTDLMPEREGIDNIVRAANQCGIKRIALLSSLVQRYNGMNGFNWWMFNMKHSAAAKVKVSGIPYTVFYASSFMENFDQLMMRGNKIMLAGQSKSPMYFIAAEDYGKQVARSFRILADENKEYVVQGLQPYNWDDGARVFIENYDRLKLKIMKVPLRMLKLFGSFSRTVNYGARILEALNNYPEQFESEPTWRELGKPVITIEEYAKSR